MARPIKTGIPYFPMDVDFLSDLKTRRLVREYGNEAIGVIIGVLVNIYRDNGYFIQADDDINFIIAEEVNTQENVVAEVINKAVEVNFFDKKLFDTYRILTSLGIQKRYLTACARRTKVEMVQEYLLVNKEDLPVNINLVNVDIEYTETPVTVNPIPESVDRSTQSKVKETKVKESKVNNTITLGDEVRENFRKLWDLYPKKTNQYESFEFYKLAIEKGTTNKEIQTGIVNYVKYLQMNKTELRYVKTDVNFFRDKFWQNHQTEPVAKYGQKSEVIPDWMKQQELEQAAETSEVTEVSEESVDAGAEALRKRMEALGLGGNDD
ncbi:Lin1244/Lin1753 domain-containing protein [Jeotgalibaca porci]|uniref:DUF4373 domain-containing protein n=1 Tax=Jeotgalibaca porci TaxID=1868793 RepID=UPI0035A10E7F